MRFADRMPDRPTVLNVCTGVRTSINDLAAILAESLGCRPHFETLPSRDGEIRHSRGDPSAAREALGFAATVSLSRGLALTTGSLATTHEHADG